MKYIVIIPARYESSRFPGKPLARIGGEEMITRVCRQVEKAGVEAVVATDDSRIRECVEKAGFRAVMTSDTHRSGTERVEEACPNLMYPSPTSCRGSNFFTIFFCPCSLKNSIAWFTVISNTS